MYSVNNSETATQDAGGLVSIICCAVFPYMTKRTRIYVIYKLPH